MASLTLPSLTRSGLRAFLEACRAGMSASGYEPDACDFDHACLRADSSRAYSALKALLCAGGTESERECDLDAAFHSETLVRGRPIALFTLRTPLRIGNWTCKGIELCAPALGNTYATGWEHIELLPHGGLGGLGGLSRLAESASGSAHSAGSLPQGVPPRVPLRSAGSSGAPELHLDTPAGLVKFHDEPLWDVVARESAQGEGVVVVDLDGTLVESGDALDSLVARVVCDLTGEAPSSLAVAEARAPTFPEFFAALGLPWEANGAAILASLERHAATAAVGTHVFEGIPALLATLAGKHRVVVWTARDRAGALAILRHHGLIEFFTGLVAADDVNAGLTVSAMKPGECSVQAVRYLAGKHAVLAVLGDSQTDARGAEALSVPFLDAGWGRSDRCPLSRAAGHRVSCATPAEASAALASLIASAPPSGNQGLLSAPRPLAP